MEHEAFQRAAAGFREARLRANAGGPLTAAVALIAFIIALVLLLPLFLLLLVFGAVVFLVLAVRNAVRGVFRGEAGGGRRNVRVIDRTRS